MKNIKNIKNTALSFILLTTLSACTAKQQTEIVSDKSYLQNESPVSTAQEDGSNTTSTSSLTQSKDSQSGSMTYLSPLAEKQIKITGAMNLTEQFSASEKVQLAADDLPLKDYLHYVMGDLLGVSYILGDQVKSDSSTVTLNLQQDVSKQKLFTVSEGILTERGYVIRLDEGIYYIHQAEGTANQGDIVYGYGNDINDVPNTSSNIIQLVPFDFGLQTQLSLVLQSIAKVKVSVDIPHNAYVLRGKRQEIIKALEFINLMDKPSYRNREIGIYKANYVSVDNIKEKLTELLINEGLTVSNDNQDNKAISIVSLESIGSTVYFVPSKLILKRIHFWLKQLDQAPSGNEMQYFYYQPQFARATDLGESLQALIGGPSSVADSNSSLGSATSAASQNKNTGRSTTRNRTSNNSSGGGDITLVVDERANALIFNTTGDKYGQLLPLIKRLDVMPKQVLLEVMIAEVKLTDNFKQGVEFALTNQGAAITGGFKLDSGAAGLSYALTGTQGNINVNLLQTNTNVNVLSRPSLLVRDGVTASITVGDDIPTVGEIITDPVNGSQTSVVYRKTGVELQVMPTINARGVVIMEINQKISNQAPGDDSVAGSPIIFERSIKTEVVAESGQTIVLGGLISENRTINDSSVPFFSSIPILGKLFDSSTDNTDKTELVVLVTPRIIESPAEWGELLKRFLSTYDNVKVEH